MRLSWVKLLAFALLGAGGLAFVAWVDRPREGTVIDRHTGEEMDENASILAANRAAEKLIAKIRETGDARLALEKLREEWGAKKRPLKLERTERLLEAELLTWDEALATDLDPTSETRDRAKGSLLLLTAKLDEKLPAETVLRALRSVEMDAAVAISTEAFFAPLAGRRRLDRKGIEKAVATWTPVDEIAALAVAAADGDRVVPETSRLLAETFRAAGRPRARIRWLLRVWEAEPASGDAALALAAAYLETGRQVEAMSVLGSALYAGIDDVEVWRMRSKVAAWQSRPGPEKEALEGLLRYETSPESRRRLVALARYLGCPEDALPHARALAEEDGTPESLAWAARLAMEAGEVDDGFDLLRRAVAAAADPRPWRERLVEALIQDLRYDDAIAELKSLDAAYPREGYDLRLETLLRRRNRTAELADLLIARLERDPNAKLGEEVISLCVALGRMERLRRLFTRRLEHETLPVTFFTNLPVYRAVDLPGLPSRALEMVRSPALIDEDVAGVLAVLSDLREDAGYLCAALALAERFPDRPETLAFRRESIDVGTTPAEAAERAERLAAERPKDPELTKVWIDRAAWAGLLESEARARRRWRDLAPDDLENRRHLAELLEADGRPAEASDEWRVLADAEGPGSVSEARLIEALRACGREEEALRRLLQRVEEPTLSIDDTRRLADVFFGARWMDVALVLFLSVLDEDPDDRLALLRVGQIRAWGNDPAGAVPYLEHLIAVHGPGDGEAPFLLAEVYGVSRREDEGRALHERALPLLSDPETLTPPRESMVARVLMRLGRIEESRAVYERLTALAPGNQDLLLDYADAMLIAGRFDEARRLVDRARALRSETRRLLRMHGALLIHERRYEETVEAIRHGIDVYGPDAGFYADLGHALTLLGRLPEAAEALDEALALVPDNVHARAARRALGDRLGPLALEIEVYGRKVDEDSAWEVRSGGAMLLDGDRTHLTAVLEHGSYAGRAMAVDAGRKDVEADVTTLSLGLVHRLDAVWTLGAGIDSYAGRDDAEPLGGWTEVRAKVESPYLGAGLRVFANEILRDPPAAVGLGGAVDGLEIEAHYEPADTWWWVSGEAVYRRLSIEHPDRGSLGDDQVVGQLLFGGRLLEDGPEIRDALRPRRAPALEVGTTTAGEPPAGLGPRASGWFAYSRIRLLGDGELAGPLPLGRKYDYVTGTVRLEGRAAAGLYYEAEAYLGTDLGDPGLFAGATLGLAWRPSDAVCARLVGSQGMAPGRDEQVGATSVRLVLMMRW
jgi:tetratricopeptide (TPR) repeat protein